MEPLTQADGVLAEASRLLGRGVADRRSPFHTPSVVTLGPDGAPEVRTVVLRAWDGSERVLTFHTDVRSAKVAQLRANPTVALHMWDPQHRIQLRLAGRATLHRNDALAAAAWRAATHGSRATYRVTQAPSAVVSDPEDVEPLGIEEDAAYANFMLVRVNIASLEWLHLAASGHRRIRFSWPDDELLSQWLTP